MSLEDALDKIDSLPGELPEYVRPSLKIYLIELNHFLPENRTMILYLLAPSPDLTLLWMDLDREVRRFSSCNGTTPYSSPIFTPSSSAPCSPSPTAFLARTPSFLSLSPNDSPALSPSPISSRSGYGRVDHLRRETVPDSDTASVFRGPPSDQPSFRNRSRSERIKRRVLERQNHRCAVTLSINVNSLDNGLTQRNGRGVRSSLGALDIAHVFPFALASTVPLLSRMIYPAEFFQLSNNGIDIDRENNCLALKKDIHVLFNVNFYMILHETEYRVHMVPSLFNDEFPGVQEAALARVVDGEDGEIPPPHELYLRIAAFFACTKARLKNEGLFMKAAAGPLDEDSTEEEEEDALRNAVRKLFVHSSSSSTLCEANDAALDVGKIQRIGEVHFDLVNDRTN